MTDTPQGFGDILPRNVNDLHAGRAGMRRDNLYCEAKGLARLGIDLSPEVADAVATLDRVAATARHLPTEEACVDVIVERLLADEEVDLDAYLRGAAVPLMIKAASEAVRRALDAFVDAMLDDRERVLSLLEEHIVEPYHQDVIMVAECEHSIERLLRDGDTATAARIAKATGPEVYARVASAERVRAALNAAAQREHAAWPWFYQAGSVGVNGWASPDEWAPLPPNTAQVVTRLRNGQTWLPFARDVERPAPETLSPGEAE